MLKNSFITMIYIVTIFNVLPLNITGGVSPYTFLWNTGATSSTLTHLNPGSYTVSVSDATGCVSTKSIAVYNDIVVLPAFGTWGDNLGGCILTEYCPGDELSCMV